MEFPPFWGDTNDSGESIIPNPPHFFNTILLTYRKIRGIIKMYFYSVCLKVFEEGAGRNFFQKVSPCKYFLKEDAS